MVGRLGGLSGIGNIGNIGNIGGIRWPGGARQELTRGEQVDKYFRRPPNPKMRVRGIYLLVGGLVAAFVGLLFGALGKPAASFLLMAVGGCVVVLGAKILYRYQRAHWNAGPKPSDADMDRLLDEDRARIVAGAMAALGITRDNLHTYSGSGPMGSFPSGGRRPVSEPLVVVSPAFTPPYAVGADRVLRFSTYQVLVVCPTVHVVGIYRCDLDFRTGLLPYEKTSEYHYQDIVAFSTETRSALGTGLFTDDNARVPSLDHNFRIPSLDPTGDEYVVMQKPVVKMFQITVSNGGRSEFLVGLADAQNPDRSARLRNSGIEETLASMRKVLQDMKGGVTGATLPWSPTGQVPAQPFGSPQPTGAWPQPQYGPPPQNGWPPHGPTPQSNGPYGPGPYGPGSYGPGPYGPGPYGPGPYGPGPYGPGPNGPGSYGPGPYGPHHPYGQPDTGGWHHYGLPPQNGWPPHGPPPDIWQNGLVQQRRSLPGGGPHSYHPGRDEPTLELDDCPTDPGN